ncbi:MAG: RNA methyltransferase [Thermaerobacter sp.]|nr:rRNA methyltransferase [Bacillota bacterium]REJ38294.1 MAG: rRNA methyltransferase [Bacillota bacterium]
MEIREAGRRSAVVQRMRALTRARGRREQGLLLVEGATVLREALRAGLTVEQVVVDRRALESGRCAALLEELARAGVDQVYAAGDEVMASLSTMATSHDLVAAVRPPAPRPVDWRRLVALDGVQDPGNVGAVLRCAAAFGFDGAWLGEGTADAFQPKVLRASAGAVFHLALVQRVDLPAALAGARRSGAVVYGLDAHHGEDPRRCRFADRLVVLVGSEGRGVTPAAAQQVDHWLRIPTDPRVESLNAAAAAAVVLYEMAAARYNNGQHDQRR